MTSRSYTVVETLYGDFSDRELERKRLLETESVIKILSSDPALRYAREDFRNGVGTRKFSRLCEINFGYDDRYTVAAYSKDKNGKVIRTWVNKYLHNSPEGDLVSETVFFPPKVGEESILYHTSKGRKYLESLKNDLERSYN